MRSVGFILEDGFQVMGLGVLSAFELANSKLRREAYRLIVMSETGGIVRSSIHIPVETTPFSDFPDTLGVVGDLVPRDRSTAVCDYIAKASEHSRRVAGFCTGAFALGQAGLLDGRNATTHWYYARNLQERFPLAKVDEDRIFIRDGNIWTSAGMTSAIDLSLALIEDDHGADLARSIAQLLVVYYRRPGGQSQFSALLALEPRSDRVRRALIYAKENLRNPLTVEELADAASLSPRQFSRIFREETGQSPAKAVERLRLEAAKAMLEDGKHPMDIVARDTGFVDRDRMRRAFVRFFGMPPQNMRSSSREDLLENVDATAQ